MKRALLILIPLIIVAGGVAGAMYYLGYGPFKKAAKKKPTLVAAKAPVAQLASATQAASAPPPSKTPVLPKAASKPAGDMSLDGGEQEAARITRLSSVYEQMPADDAGRIFAKLPDPLVEKLLRQMDERQVGKVLLAMDVNRAARLTQSLAK